MSSFSIVQHFRDSIAVLTAAIMLIASPLMAADNTTFTRETRFGPISMSHEQLAALINKLESIARTANANIAADRIEHSLRMGDDVNSIRVSGEITSSALSAAPPVVTSAYYEYRALDAPISHIEIQLWDTRRSISVDGKSLEQVEALMGVATSTLANYNMTFGGSGHRIIAGMNLILIGISLPALTFSEVGGVFKLVLVIAGPALSLSVMILPWDRWFPGTAIYPGDVSFIVRHAAMISFLGLVVTIVTSCAGLLVRPYWKRFR